MKIHLKEAYEEHCELLFKWVNDKVTRENSFSNKEISYEEHVKWFNKKLNSDNSKIFILYNQEIPLGQVRVDIENEKAVISYSIDKNFRGKGYGSKILELLEDEIKKSMVFIKRLVGYVKYDNMASRKIFKNLGYTEISEGDSLEYYKEV